MIQFGHESQLALLLLPAFAVLLVGQADVDAWVYNVPKASVVPTPSVKVETLEPCQATCDNAVCPPVTQCSMGVVRDRCGCCSVCGLEQNQLCNLESELEFYRGGNNQPINAWHGHCGVDLECRDRSDVDKRTVGRQSICYCLKSGLVCGSDGHTYSRCRMHAVNKESNGTVAIFGQGPCKSEPKIVMISESRGLNEGEKVTFICEVQGYPMPTVTWYYSKPGRAHDSLLLPGDSDEMSVSLRGGPQLTGITSHLQITEFALKHEGEYRCTAENDLGMASKTLSAVRKTGLNGLSNPPTGKKMPERPFDNYWAGAGWDDL